MMQSTGSQHEEQKVAQEYNFGIGHPSSALNLPKALIAKCINKHLNPDNSKYYTESTDYGLCQGSWYFRSNLADWVNALSALNKHDEDKKYEAVTGSNMVLTTGASQSMELLLIHLKRMKNKVNKKCANIVLCEDPSYYLFPNITETAGCTLLPIGFINNRLDFDLLEKMLTQYGNDVVCFYVIPNHHNPLGISYNSDDKIKLIQLCHKYKLHVIADEVYNLLSFDDDRMMIPFMASIEQTLFPDDSTLYCHSISSFSKIIGPGFRVGWIYSGNADVVDLITDHGSLRSGGCMSHFVPSVLQYLLVADDDADTDVDMTAHLIKVRRELATNCHVLCETIRQYDTQNLIQFNEPKGGYFMWLQVPQTSIEIIADKEAKVTYFDGKKLSSTFGPISKEIQFIDDASKSHQQQQKGKYFDTCVRFCFAYLNQQQIREGAKQFVQSIYNIRSQL